MEALTRHPHSAVGVLFWVQLDIAAEREGGGGGRGGGRGGGGGGGREGEAREGGREGGRERGELSQLSIARKRRSDYNLQQKL